MPQERRLAAILSADVAGYSRLMAEDEQGTILLAEFPSALDVGHMAAAVDGSLYGNRSQGV